MEISQETDITYIDKLKVLFKIEVIPYLINALPKININKQQNKTTDTMHHQYSSEISNYYQLVEKMTDSSIATTGSLFTGFDILFMKNDQKTPYHLVLEMQTVGKQFSPEDLLKFNNFFEFMKDIVDLADVSYEFDRYQLVVYCPSSFHICDFIDKFSLSLKSMSEIAAQSSDDDNSSQHSESTEEDNMSEIDEMFNGLRVNP